MTSPTVALRLTLPPVVMTDSLLVPAPPALVIVNACAACTSTVPLPDTVISPAAPKVTLPAVAITLTDPPAVVKPALKLTPLPAPCSKTWPTVADGVPVSATA